MNDSRNPFRLRTSEKIESIENFLRLFGPDALDSLPDQEPWNQVVVIRSAPGGGKTSLLRLFTPQALSALHDHRHNDEYRELFRRLMELGAFRENGPAIMGVMLSCGGDYASICDLIQVSSQRVRLFMSLLNARITIGALRTICSLTGIAYPKDLDRVTVRLPEEVRALDQLVLIQKGSELHAWAVGVESAICSALDSFGPLDVERLPGNDSLFAFDLIHARSFELDGVPVGVHTLLMLDDVQELAREQSDFLRAKVAGGRPPIGVWLAERYEALPVDELLASGAIEGRDYAAVVNLGEYWRTNHRSKKYENAVIGIADRRARNAAETLVDTFGAHLSDDIGSAVNVNQVMSARDLVRGRILGRISRAPEFASWLEHVDESGEAGAWDELLTLRILEIQMSREEKRVQRRFSFAVSDDMPEAQPAAPLRAVAEFLLSQEFGWPYYFGPSRLASLSSTNIQQFIWLAGGLFEEMIASALMHRVVDLSPARQEAILRRAVADRWKRIPMEVRYGREVKRFLERIGSFAKEVTMQPNAPYVPGVTGIAITMRDRDILRDPAVRKRYPQLDQLANIISSCIAHNLLQPNPDYKVKGDYHLVLYLNRMLCLQFGLPVGYGGFRERSLEILSAWLSPEATNDRRQKGFV